MVKKYLSYIKGNVHHFQEGDLVVAINKGLYDQLLIGHRYYVYEIYVNNFLDVKDAVNNEKFHAYYSSFVSENEYLYGKEKKNIIYEIFKIL